MKAKAIKYNVGADLAKDDFKVCLYGLMEDHRKPIKGSRSFANTLKGFKSFVDWVNKKCKSGAPIRVTLEATGVYYEQLVHYLDQQTDMIISVVLPNMAKAYAKSLNQKSKTDKLDAKSLGLMGLERELSIWKPLSSNILIIKQLTRERVSLLEGKTSLSNQLHALNHSFQPNKDVIKRLKDRIKMTQKQIKEVEKQIKGVVQKDQPLKEKIEKVCKIKGVALITVATIVAETNGFAAFTSRAQLSSYAGYDVVHNQSGTSIKGKTRISKKGNRFIRRALHFPAIIAVKYDDRFKQLYQRIVDKTAIKMKGYVAVQHKLLRLIYALFKKNVAYDSNYLKQAKVQNKSRQDTSPAYTG